MSGPQAGGPGAHGSGAADGGATGLGLPAHGPRAPSPAGLMSESQVQGAWEAVSLFSLCSPAASGVRQMDFPQVVFFFNEKLSCRRPAVSRLCPTGEARPLPRLGLHGPSVCASSLLGWVSTAGRLGQAAAAQQAQAHPGHVRLPACRRPGGLAQGQVAGPVGGGGRGWGSRARPWAAWRRDPLPSAHRHHEALCPGGWG